MAEEKKTGEKKHITGARIAKEIRQYKKDALLSPMYTTLCVVLEILIPYLTASIIDKGIAVGDMEPVSYTHLWAHRRRWKTSANS